MHAWPYSLLCEISLHRVNGKGKHTPPRMSLTRWRRAPAVWSAAVGTSCDVLCITAAFSWDLIKLLERVVVFPPLKRLLQSLKTGKASFPCFMAWILEKEVSLGLKSFHLTPTERKGKDTADLLMTSLPLVLCPVMNTKLVGFHGDASSSRPASQEEGEEAFVKGP